MDPQAGSSEDTFTIDDKIKMDHMLMDKIDRAQTKKELVDATLTKKLLDMLWASLCRSDESIMQHVCDQIEPKRMPQVSGMS